MFTPTIVARTLVAAKPWYFSTPLFSKRVVMGMTGNPTTIPLSPFSYLAAQPNSASSAAESFHSQFNAMRYWNPPLRVSCLTDELLKHPTCDECGGGVHTCNCNKNHWLVILQTKGLEFATEQALFDHYIKILANVLESEEEAKKKIYLVSCGWLFGFGTVIDKETKFKLEVCSGVAAILEDYHYHARNPNSGVGSGIQFTPINWNHRLNDIYSYYHLSNCQSKEKSGHWLIHIQQPDGGIDSEKHAFEYCADLLAEFVGSEAKKKIYIVWCKVPFGFGAEIDEKTSDKLRDLPNVLEVLPDYAADVKNMDRGVLLVSPSCHSESGSEFIFDRLHLDDPVDSEGVMYSVYYDDAYSRNEALSGSCCKHWFIIMERPVVGPASTEKTVDYYIKALASVIGSENEAKGKSFGLTCEDDIFGFSAEIDEETSNILKGVSGVRAVFPVFLCDKDHKVDNF